MMTSVGNRIKNLGMKSRNKKAVKSDARVINALHEASGYGAEEQERSCSLEKVSKREDSWR